MNKPLSRKLAWLAPLVLLALAAAAAYPVVRPAPMNATPAPALSVPSGIDLSSYSDAPPERPVNLVFLHHSVGEQLLADEGAHPNAGGLRRQLEANHYAVNEASYGSAVGEKTDLFDWLPKFRTQMDRILRTRQQDQLLDTGRNQIVMFKSCFPNSFFRPDKTHVGNPDGPVLTLSSAQATMLAMRDELSRQPDTLFIYVTAPPLRAHETREPLWKFIAKKILGRETNDVEQVNAANNARAFNNWVKSPEGWLKGYPGRNIVVFDYYDLLTGGESNFLKYPSGGGKDDHPSAVGQHLAAAQLVPFINRAVRYAGISG